MSEHAELSPTDWVREQTERILEQGTTDGVEILDRPVVLVTTTGAKSGKKRYVPLRRVEENGRYARRRLVGLTLTEDSSGSRFGVRMIGDHSERRSDWGPRNGQAAISAR